CVQELGLSEDAASNRITVARLASRFPAILEAYRSGRVHLSGLRMLSHLFTEANHLELLALARGKSRRQLEELIARLEPKPPVPDSIRKLPQRAVPAPVPVPVAATKEEPPSPTPVAQPPVSLALATAPAPRPSVQPLSADTYKIQFTASRPLKDKVQQARDLLRHQVRDGDLATIVEQALDLLIAKVKKERFGVGAKPRSQARASQAEDTGLGVGAELGKQPRAPRAGSCPPLSRHIPVVIRRAVYERDGDRCTYVSEDGRRCEATGDLEFDHLEGFARTHVHAVDSLALRCRAHNAFAAEQMYGRQFMEEARRSIRPGADRADLLL
ncbi:MAG: HNH endonuclease, partial [Myxococcaceae bacterium]